MKLSVLFSLVPAAMAFMDTGAFYASRGKYNVNGDALMGNVSSVNDVVHSLSDMVCRGAAKRNLVIHRVANLSHKKLHQEFLKQEVDSSDYFSNPPYYAKNVHYSSPDQLELNLSPGCPAEGIEYFDASDVSPSSSAYVVVIEYANEEDFDYSKALASADNSHYVIVQGLPSFKAPETKLEGWVRYVEDEVKENLNIDLDFNNLKRDSSEQYRDEEFDNLVSEVEDDFKSAESYIAQEGEDLPVHILDSEVPSDEGRPQPLTSNSTVTYPDNLFTNYEFFTPGLLSGLIVSFILISILYVTLSWMSSLEISYKSFEKQIDYEKKTE